MKILVINGDCIQTNSSANLCHLAYLRGLSDAGHEITLISSDGKDYRKDPAMVLPDGIMYYTYPGMSLYEKLSLKKRRSSISIPAAGTQGAKAETNRRRASFFRRMKIFCLKLYGVHGIYRPFVNKARRFSSKTVFDVVISLSTPPSSHLLAYELLKRGRIQAKRWIQIWEDPWYSDAYGFNRKEEIYQEEKRLLGFAEKVCYVSPITLENQKALFPESAGKMYWQPLPSYYTSDTLEEDKGCAAPCYGYFGNYYSAARNLVPFYQAARERGVRAVICGDSNLRLECSEKLRIRKRVPLDELRGIEAQTDVLVFLCNSKGGQIPGKIYQYAASDKTILFILDGTEEEKKTLRDFFEPFHRFVFCENRQEDIDAAMERIGGGDLGGVVNRPLTDFDPKRIIANILEEGMR